MGLDVDRDHFEDEEYTRFARRLESSLDALRLVLARPGFGEGPPSIGAELELSLVDPRGRPLPINREVLAEAADPQLTVEIDRFNLEINAPPFPLAGRPFRALTDAVRATLDRAAQATARVVPGGRLAVIGILPTLEIGDLQSHALTRSHRYRAMSRRLRELRGGAPFAVRIQGAETLELEMEDVTLEGANTSFQVHLRVSAADYGRAYNAAQLATAPVLALAANSPYLLGKQLWEETRVALFRHAVDDRADSGDDDWRPARVSFGHGWVREGLHELFTESVAMHAPLLPVLSGEDPLEVAASGGIPELAELRLHQGTVWRWNRAIYDHAEGGHLRIELRALPAGPTLTDMMANAAFLVGLTLGLAPIADTLVHRITFGQARRNFYEAARFGADATLLWPSTSTPSPAPFSARDLVLRLLPFARAGLIAAGMDPEGADHHLSVIAARASGGQTGAAWQRATVAAHGGDDAARTEMLRRYLDLSAEDRPVHLWPI